MSRIKIVAFPLSSLGFLLFILSSRSFLLQPPWRGGFKLASPPFFPFSLADFVLYYIFLAFLSFYRAFLFWFSLYLEAPLSHFKKVSISIQSRFGDFCMYDFRTSLSLGFIGVQVQLKGNWRSFISISHVSYLCLTMVLGMLNLDYVGIWYNAQYTRARNIKRKAYQNGWRSWKRWL